MLIKQIIKTTAKQLSARNGKYIYRDMRFRTLSLKPFPAWSASKPTADYNKSGSQRKPFAFLKNQIAIFLLSAAIYKELYADAPKPPMTADTKPVKFEYKLSDNGAVIIDDIIFETPRLCIRKATLHDFPHYKKLFTNDKVTQKYGKRRAYSDEEIYHRLMKYEQRATLNIPFVGFSIFLKQSGEFIGQIVLDFDDEPGTAELGYAFLPEFWNKGYGKEASLSLLEIYLPEIIKRYGGKMPTPNLKELTGFNQIHATCVPDNKYSKRILEKTLKMSLSEETKGGRLHYYRSVRATVPNSHNTAICITPKRTTTRNVQAGASPP